MANDQTQENYQTPELDTITGQTTTGHRWDGIAELNTPLPRWWLWSFYFSIIWAIGYWVVYPAWPLISSYTTGAIGYSSRAEVTEEMKALETFRERQAQGLKTASLAEIRANPALFRIALARGKAAFGDNCVGCHGQGGAGAPGYPSLTDDEWLWGGTLDAIQLTLNHGVRWTQDDKTRLSEMTAFGRMGILKREDIEHTVEYVRSLARLDIEKSADLARGKALYEANCVACHGTEGKGNKELGAPDLTDAIWLYGSSRKAMVESIWNGRNGAMPAWSGRLDPVTIKALTVYVHSLGGGQ